jgi:hypothetical protein
MCVAAAIAGAAVVGAGATAYAGSEAAGATKDATNAAIQQQQSALQQQAQLSAPYRALGQSAIPTLESLLGLGKGGSAGALSTLRNMPGYQFEQQQGTEGTVNQASAMGLGLSGNTLQGLSKFNQGLAGTTYQQEVGNVTNAVGLGQAASAGQAANIGNAANNISNLTVGQGQTLAGIDANTIAGITKAIGGGIDTAVLQRTLAGLKNQGGSGLPDPNVGP